MASATLVRVRFSVAPVVTCAPVRDKRIVDVMAWRIDYNTEPPHGNLRYLSAPHLRPLLTPPHDGT